MFTRFFTVSVLVLTLIACQSNEESSSTMPTAEPETAVSTEAQPAESTTDSPDTPTFTATAEPIPADTVIPATNTPMPTPTAAPLMLETLDGPIEVQPLLPVSYDELLDTNIETGEWTEAEGIIILLQSFVGEVDSNMLPEVIESSSTPIVRRAADIANNPDTNAEDAAEIERLLDILVPTTETLDQLSIPASEASAKPNGVFKTAVQADACADLSTKGYKAKNLEGITCFLYEEAQLEGHKYRVYYPNEWKDDEAKRELINAALFALTDSASVYGKLAKIEDVNLVFSYADGGTALASQAYFDLDSACPITLFANKNQGSMDVFKQTIAHEVFHCVQDWNFTTSPYASHKWWLEGSAEYFSNVVYPTVNDEHRFLDSFNRNSVDKTLMEMSYHNFVFFQYMANRIGDQGLISLLKTMSATGGPSAHAAHLADYPDMDGMFQDFVVSFLSEGVADTGGSSIKPAQIAIKPIQTISEEGENEFHTKPFVATRYGIKYVKEKRFLLEGNEDGNGRYSTVLKELRRTKTAWSDLPEEIRSKCDDAVLYVLATTNVKEDFAYTINVTEMEKAECDPCLLGSWDIEPNSFEAFIMGIMAETPDMPAGFYVEIAGHNYLKFHENGELTTLRENLQISMGITGQPGVISTINGHGSGMYTADGEIMTVTNLVQTVDSVIVTTADGQVVTTLSGNTANVSFFGNSTTLQTGEDINSDAGPVSATGNYICTEETLEIEKPEGTALFLRVEEIPPTPVPTPSP